MTEQTDRDGRDSVYDRPIAYEEEVDGQMKVVYRASSLGFCAGALVRARLGVNGAMPSDWMQERFDEGRDWEERVLIAGLGEDYTRTVDLDYLEPYGRVVESDAGLQVETEVAWGNKVIRCHPDAIVTKREGFKKMVCEVKFLGEQMYRDMTRPGGKGLSETYKWQASIEMLSTGLPMLYVIGEKVVKEGKRGERVVELGEVWTCELDEPYYTLKDVKARVLEIEGYVARGEMPACPTPLMYPCPYWDHHEAPEKVVCEDEALVAWVDVWKRADEAYGKAALDLEFARNAVREQMKELGLESARCDGVDITVVEASEQGNVSWAKAYKALAKEAGKVGVRVNEDEFRGNPRAGYVTVKRVDEGKGES